MEESKLSPAEDLFSLLKQLNKAVAECPEENRVAEATAARIRKGMSYLMSVDDKVYKAGAESIADIRCTSDKLIYERLVDTNWDVLRKLGIDEISTFKRVYIEHMTTQISKLTNAKPSGFDVIDLSNSGRIKFRFILTLDPTTMPDDQR